MKVNQLAYLWFYSAGKQRQQIMLPTLNKNLERARSQRIVLVIRYIGDEIAGESRHTED